MDEHGHARVTACIRCSPSLWLWIAVSRSVGSVLGFVIADRTDSALERLLVEELPPDWRDTTAVCTDFWRAYGRSLPTDLHEACTKGSGKTSKIEALNTLWRQRHSGLVRRSCGVSRRVTDDLVERFLFLAHWHNCRCLKQWEKRQQSKLAETRSDP